MATMLKNSMGSFHVQRYNSGANAANAVLLKVVNPYTHPIYVSGFTIYQTNGSATAWKARIQVINSSGTAKTINGLDDYIETAEFTNSIKNETNFDTALKINKDEHILIFVSSASGSGGSQPTNVLTSVNCS